MSKLDVFFSRKEVEMKKLVLLAPAIACVSQGIATERFTVNAGDLFNDNYKMVIINTGKITTRTLNYLHAPSNYTFETLSAKEKEVTKAWFRYKGAKEFNKYFKMEFDTTQADKIILKKVSRTQANNSNHPKEFDLIIPGKIYGKKVEPGDKAFSDLFILKPTHDSDNISLNLKLERAKDGTPVKIVNGKGLFKYGRSVTSIDGSGADTSNVTDMSYMFYGCRNLKSLNLSSFGTENVTNMESMFRNCESLTKLVLSNFNTKNVAGMHGIFAGCNSLTYLDVSKFDTKKVTNMRYMFHDCNSLTSLALSKFDTKNVTNMDSMFDGCSSLTYLDVSKFDTKNVIDMSCMFRDCNSLAYLDVSKFDTKKVTNMRYMFDSCSSLTFLDISKFDTKKVTKMDGMFRNCNSLTFLNVRGFDISNVIIVANLFLKNLIPFMPMWWQDMFQGCPNLINQYFAIRFESEPQIRP